MLIRISACMSLKTRYLTKRGEVFQFYLRIPTDLVARYGKQFIRQSLRTSDQRVAVGKAEALAKRFHAEFEAMRNNPQATPLEVSLSAKELAQALSEHDALIDQLLEPKRHAFAEASDDPESTYRDAPPSAYLSPVEAQAVQIMQEGLDVVRLSDAIKLYWTQHKRSGDARYVLSVERDWNRLVNFVGDIAVESLSRATARQYVEHLLSHGLKTGSVRRKLNHINAVLNTAIKEAEISKVNPFAHLKIPGEGADIQKAPIPSVDQLRDITKKFQGKSSATYLLALIMIETGPRIAEISGLKTSDVFIEAPEPFVRIEPNEWRGIKTIFSHREVPLVGVSLDAMKVALKLPRKNDALFPAYAKENGGTNASAAVNKILKPWGITSKGFRHSLKDRLREVGCPKDVRDAIQGHENGDVAETYGRGHTLKTMQDWLERAKILPD